MFKFTRPLRCDRSLKVRLNRFSINARRFIRFESKRLDKVTNSLLRIIVCIGSINLDSKQLAMPVLMQQHLEHLISLPIFQYLHKIVNPYVNLKPMHSMYFEPGPELLSISHKYRSSLESFVQQNTESSVAALWCGAALRVETGRYQASLK